MAPPFPLLFEGGESWTARKGQASRLREDPMHELEDGLTVFADVKEVDGETLVRKRRMVFVADTAPIRAVRKLKQGQCMLVLGMPRLNLSLVSFRAREGANDSDVLTWSLPYEMVIVGDFGTTAASREVCQPAADKARAR